MNDSYVAIVRDIRNRRSFGVGPFATREELDRELGTRGATPDMTVQYFKLDSNGTWYERTAKEHEDFFDLVLQMRNAQKEYFRTRDRGVLEKSKTLERRVDAILKERKDPQMSLFTGGQI